MQLSIVIPVYNWDITPLLTRLATEIEESSLETRVEVTVLDDCSTDAALRSRNEEFLSRQPKGYLKYGALQRNTGRAVIRNLLAAGASGEFLLFLDCDVLPDREDFVRSYLARAEERSYDVVCGGISYRTRILHGREFDYHAYLGNKKEVKAAADRNQAPWRHILTSNIMVRKSVFQATPFDERFTGYGYEDIEWGVRLSQQYRILHIDNTASHLGLVSRSRTYDKMCNSVPNYLLLKRLCPMAFDASSISKVVRLLLSCNSGLLRRIDRILRSSFLSEWLCNRLAFIVFQLNFAVLLALALKEAVRAEGPAPSQEELR